MERAITISREFGSGGRELGVKLAESLGIPFYDKELISMAAEESDMSEDAFLHYDENMPFIKDPLDRHFYSPFSSIYQVPMSDQIFLAQSRVIRKLVDLWAQRFTVLSADENIRYVFIFENRGDVVGVTMPHPHGQIYAYPFLPKKLELELENAGRYKEEKGCCLFCDMLQAEKDFGKRIIFENEHFTVFLPFFTEYPYGVYIMSNRHRSNITQFDEDERLALAETLRRATGMLDSLFGYKFPYMMCMYNEPVGGIDASDFYHFHIAFYPPMRSADKIKYNASSETGAWAHCNPTCPEDTAEELRAAYRRFMGE